MTDKISIILPIFNVGDHLRGGIDSLLNQTIGQENLEIIMVNDCSTDGSGEIIDEYGKCLKCVKIYKANQIFPKKEYDNIRENSLYQNNNIIF